MRNKKIFIAFAVVLFLVTALLGYFGPDMWRTYTAEREKAAFIPAGVPKRVVDEFRPQFEKLLVADEPMYLPDVPFLDSKGKQVRISDFEGKPTLVNLWATWCAPCVVELPYLKELTDQYGDRLNVVGIALEQGKEPAQIATFLEKRELGNFAAYVDKSGEFGQKLGIRGIPTSFLIGSDGLILYRFEGDAVWTGQQSKAFFDIFLLQNR
jgi:thiol-disulfide isomerase/thioredoxin